MLHRGHSAPVKLAVFCCRNQGREQKASEDPLNRNRKHFIARVVTPLTQPHESRQGPPRRNTGKFRSHQQGVEGYSQGEEVLRASLWLSEHAGVGQREVHICGVLAV
ncbi:hypothetical protein AMECASPLE_008366 [Ameca splendens]|uniref:Uncharacterized protein n=1 Tax=Ameca splendens TaxID=208324 RepID=A0ABV0YM12_9TELE